MDDLSELFVPDRDESRLLAERNCTRTPFDDRPVDDLIWTAAVPAEAIACRSAAGELSRAEFLARADAVAAALQARGIGRGAVVGVLMAAGLERLVAVAAVLRSGAAFLPIEPALPDGRVRSHCVDSRARCVIVDPANRGRSALGELVVSAEFFARPQPHFRSPAGRSGDDCAYVVYTSGTTGKPKAAINSHRALANRLQWMARDLGVERRDRIAHKTPFGFDVAVWEQLLPLVTGAVAVIASEELRTDPAGLDRFFAAQGVTIAHFVPSLLSEYLDARGGREGGALRAIVASGEALSPVTARRALALPGVRLCNYYGPSEAAIDVTAAEVLEPVPANVAIGRPIQNCAIHILDPRLDPVVPGAEGELFIGGLPVGGGYLNRPRLTAERFVPDPFGDAAGARLYRTGDVARWRADGEIEFLGRRDRQLKVNGLRIEPGEVEAAIADHAGCTAIVDAVPAPSGARILAAFVVTDKPLDEPALRAALQQRLPSYMVPAVFVAIAAAPRGATGKIDQAALAGLCREHFEADDRGDDNLGAAETDLAKIWGELLRRPVRTRSAHFFKLGGDSILAIRMVARLRATGWSIAVQDVFDRPELADLAAALVPLEASTAATPAATALRGASAGARAILAPQLRIASVPREHLLDRLATLVRALSGESPRIETLDARSFGCAALRIGASREAHAAVAFDADESAFVAFDPALLDDLSLAAAAAWLEQAQGLPPILQTRAPAPQLSRLQALDAPAEADEGIEVEAIAVAAPAPDGSRASRDAERRLDAIAALAIDALQRRVGRTLAALLPESRAAAAAAAEPWDGRIGRIGLPAMLAAHAPTAEQVMAARLGADAAADAIDIVLRRADGLVLDADKARAVAGAAPRFGKPVLVLGDEQLFLIFPSSAAQWARGALAGLERTALDAAIAAALPLRHPADFPLAGLGNAELAAIASDEPRIEDAYPLAPLQEGMLMRAAYWPQSDAYLNQNVIDLHGPLDPVALERAWDEVVRRYEVLRAAYRYQGLERPLALVTALNQVPFERLDWSGLPAADAKARLAELLADDRGRPFDLGRFGLYRLRLVRLSDDHHVLVWTHHHILLDGWCLALIWGDVARFYAAQFEARPLPPQPRPFRDFIGWLRDHPPGEGGRAFWRATLEGARPSLLSSRPRTVEGLVATRREPLRDDRRRALVAAAAALGVTANAYIQAAWALLISLRSGRSDVVHGVSISGRPPELEGADAMVGLFINTIPLRTSAKPSATAAEYLLSVQAALAAATRHGTLSLPEILAEWPARRSPDDRLFDSLIAFENYPDENLPSGAVAGVTFADRLCDEKTEYPIGLIVLPGDPFEIHLNYDSAHFDEPTVDDYVGDLFDLLDRLIDAPQERLANFALRSVGEPAGAGRPAAAVELATLVDRGSDAATALLAGDRSWSYETLRRAVDAAAAMLPDPAAAPVVALLFERSPAFVVALLACWRRGTVPLVVNPALPDAQVAAAIEDGGSPPVWASDALRARLADGGYRLLAPVELSPEGDCSPPPPPPAAPEHAAILLTSGTTGRPKLVFVPRQGVEARIGWTRDIYDLQQPVLLANAAPGFDIGLWEVAWPLAGGGTIVLADDDAVRDPEAFVSLLAQHQVDTLHVTPTLGSGLAERRPSLPALRLVVTGGETVTPAAAERLRGFGPRVAVWQGYGPSEASISVSDHLCETSDPGGERLPIGAPMPGCVVRLLDPALRPVPPGAVGIIHIGGTPIGAGYVGNARLTAAAFVPDPLGRPGSRLFRTGDLGRWRDDGLLEHLGRADRQVKLRGFRVQPEEIEEILRRHPQVAAAVVLVEQEDGEPVLEAYVVPVGSPGDAATVAELRAWQRRHLPPYAVAHRIHQVGAVPLTRNGKADHDALRLRRREPAVPVETGASFATPLERAIAASWEEALGEPPPGPAANFFECGGHSMTAMRMIAALQRRLGGGAHVRIPLLFKFPTVTGLAEAMSGSVEGAGGSHLRRLASGTDGAPLVLVHPVEGVSTAYGPLAKHLAHRAVFTIDDPRLGSETGFGSLAEMAGLYLEWVRAEFGDGPVILGGWSFGGAVALAMAQAMADHAEPPSGLFLIDSYDLAGRVEAGELAGGALGALDALAADDSLRGSVEPLRRQVRRNGALAAGAEASPYPHPVQLFAATERDHEVDRRLGPANGWPRRLPNLTVTRIEGDHRAMMADPGVAALAAAIDRCWP